jgi:hypothetical protein
MMNSSWICFWIHFLFDFYYMLLRANLQRWAPALDQTDQNRNHSEDEQDVNESAQRVRADHAQQPENQEQNGYSPEHWNSFVRA